MHSAMLMALALGNAASVMGAFSNGTTGAGTPTNSGGPLLPTGGALPQTVGPFKLVGCFVSNSGFPNWQMTGSSDMMDLDMCAASCPSKYMGVYDTDCYCGDVLQSSARQVTDGSCDAKCPGNDAQSCGGQLRSAKRQVGPGGAYTPLVSVYERSNNGGNTGTGTATSGSTLTKTYTSTHIGTVTSCAPEVTNCPVGHKTTNVQTVTATYCPEENQWAQERIVCYGNWCIKESPCVGDQCSHSRVICEGQKCWTEQCPEEEAHKLVICQNGLCKYADFQGEQCQHKVVCYGNNCMKQQCYGDECKQNVVCNTNGNGSQNYQYQSCTTDCYKQISCSNGDCQTVPPCTENCPVPPPPGPAPTGPVPAPQPNPNPNPQPTAPPSPPPPPPPSSNGTSPPIAVGGSDKTLPAFGISFLGAIAGLAFML